MRSDALRVVVTSVVRHARSDQNSGVLRIVDWDRKRVIMKTSLPESAGRANDVNPRGGSRGLRGVASCGDRLLVANAESVFVVDPSLRVTSQITHPLMGGVHDICAEDDGVWVTCTTSDLLLKMDWQGNVIGDWEWRLDRQLTRSFGFRHLSRVKRGLDYRDPQSSRVSVANTVHLNAVSRGPEGLLLSFGRVLSPAALRKAWMKSVFGRIAKSAGLDGRRPTFSPLPSGVIQNSSSALVLVRTDGSTRLLKHVTGTAVPNHNVLQVNGALVYNDTNRGRLVAMTLDGSRPDVSVPIPGQPSFVRGLAHLGGRIFLVGSQAPPAVYQVDLDSAHVSDQFVFDDGQPHESVFGLCVLPGHFKDGVEFVA